MSVFETAALAALPVFQAVYGESVTYTRGSDTVTVTAIRNDIEVQTVSTDGVYTTYASKAFSIKKTDLLLSAAQVTPAPRDTITDSNGVIYKYMNDYDYKRDTGEYVIPVTEVV